jgi:hypothetical protein
MGSEKPSNPAARYTHWFDDDLINRCCVFQVSGVLHERATNHQLARVRDTL